MRRVLLPKRAQKKQTRALLVDAALRVFAERGYEEATVDDIAAAAGYSKGAYYFHFASKEDIFLELLERWIGEQTERLRAFEQGLPAAAALVEMLEAFMAPGDRDGVWPPLVVEFWAQSRRNDGIRQGLSEAYSTWRGILAEAFRRAAGSGLLSPRIDADDAARLVLATHDGLAREMSVDPEGTRRVSPRRVIGALLAYLASPGSEEPPEAARSAASKRPAAKARRRSPAA